MRTNNGSRPLGGAIKEPSPSGSPRHGLGTGGLVVSVSLLLLGLIGCARLQDLAIKTAPSPQVPWTPPPEALKPVAASPAPQIPAELLPTKQTWTLVNLVDIGLSNNQQTRAAWAAARSAAAALGAARGSYFPKINLDLNGTKTKGTVAGRFTYDYNSLSPSASLSFLLFDFGGRKAAIDEARQTLAAANWTQNFVVQNVILQVELNYYNYVTVRELLKAQETNLKDAEANLDAAEIRHRAGVATIADVLQAKTALSSADLNVISTQGLVQELKGALANAAGLPANTIYDVVDGLPPSLPLDRVSSDIDRFIAEAQTQRPDLAAARSQALRAEAHIQTVRSAALPTLVASGNIGRTYYNISPNPSDNYALAVVLDVPLFSGFSHSYQILQAKMDAETAQAQAQKLEQDVILQVWTSYYNLKTAAQRIKSAQDLFDFARQSYEVALAGYKGGVNSILDLLAADSSLESGRVQLIQAKTDWLLSLVQFTHDTGRLGLPEAAFSGTKPVTPDKGVD